MRPSIDNNEDQLRETAPQEDSTRRSRCCSIETDHMEPLSPMSPVQSLMSRQTSSTGYAEPSQTLLFLDWDDTLFPTSALLDDWGLKVRNVQQGHWSCSFYPPLKPHQQEQLDFWQGALQRFIHVACEATTCIIVTNAKPGWVETCLQCFAPEVADFFFGEGGPRIVYAREVLSDMTKRKKISGDSLAPQRVFLEDDDMRASRHDEEMMSAKLEAMHLEASKFYSSYPGQSWKNILSFGDQPYERDALQEIGMRRISPKPEQLRIKTLLLPSNTPVSKLGPRLDTLRMLLPAFVNLGSDLDVDLQSTRDPLAVLSEKLELPKLKDLSSQACVWGASTSSADLSLEDALVELSEAVMHS